MCKLYKGIANGTITTDPQARIYLYGSPDAKSRYYEVKRRLKSKLLDFLFVFEPQSGSIASSQNALYLCLRIWFGSLILAKEQSRHTASKLLDSLISTAVKHEFTDIIILASNNLLSYYGNYNPNKIKYKYYSNLLKTHRAILEAETSAEIAYYDIQVLFAKSQKGIPKSKMDQIRAEHDQTLNRFLHIKSRRFLRMFYLYKIICAEVAGQNSIACVLCDEALKVLDSKPFDTPGAQLSLGTRKLASLIKLKRYAEGRKLALEDMQNLRNHRINWHVLALYFFVLNCHDQEYTIAYKTVTSALQKKALNGLIGKFKQLWYVNEAYAHFFYKCGKVDITEEEESKIKKFRIYKFLNEVPTYSNDKAGVNISILIIQMLFLIWEEKYKAAHDRISSLNSYCQKYLSRGETYRSHCFIKMLVQLAKADLHSVRGQRYAQKYYDKVIAHPFAKSRQAIEVEVVPYEDLWMLILEMCDRNGNGYQSRITPTTGAH